MRLLFILIITLCFSTICDAKAFCADIFVSVTDQKQRDLGKQELLSRELALEQGFIETKKKLLEQLQNSEEPGRVEALKTEIAQHKHNIELLQWEMTPKKKRGKVTNQKKAEEKPHQVLKVTKAKSSPQQPVNTAQPVLLHGAQEEKNSHWWDVYSRESNSETIKIH